MKIIVNIDNTVTRLSNKSSYVQTKGLCVIDNESVKGFQFAKYLKTQNDNLILDGNYCYIKKVQEKVIISVDHIRSYPLFYSIENNKLIISDRANWILDQSSFNEYDNLAKNELWLSGYVLGENTLCSNIKQVLPGEIIEFSYKKNKININKNRVFSYTALKNTKEPLEDLIEEHQCHISKAIQKLINRADGKTLVIPLSGGLDSRLLALQLKLHGYKNVICFSYGTSFNNQSKISKETAEKLDYKWVFVKYNRQLWKNAYGSNEFKQYFYSADNLNSLPHIQDWLSIKYLIQKELIPKDSIIVPGHTGDFLATGHIPPYFDNISSIEQLTDEIIKKHFRVNNYMSLSYSHKKHLEIAIKKSLNYTHIRNAVEAKEAFQYFDWQERQSKFIINSLRVYDYFNLEWSVPLWDIDVVDFWRKIPFSLKKNKHLYKMYLLKINKYNVFDDLIGSSNLESDNTVNPLKVVFRKFKSIIQVYEQQFKKRFLYYFTHEFQWYGMFSYWKVVFSKSRLQNINTILVNDYLNKFK